MKIKRFVLTLIGLAGMTAILTCWFFMSNLFAYERENFGNVATILSFIFTTLSGIAFLIYFLSTGWWREIYIKSGLPKPKFVGDMQLSTDDSYYKIVWNQFVGNQWMKVFPQPVVPTLGNFPQIAILLILLSLPFFLIFGAIVGTFFGSVCRSSTEDLDKKLYELADVGETLENKVNAAEVTLNALSENFKETKIELVELKFANYNDAMNNQLGRQKMLIMQKVVAYQEFLTNERMLLIAAINEIRFMSKQTEIDRLLVSNYDSDPKTKELISSVNQVIDKYLPQTGDLVLPENMSNKKPLKEIWQKYVQEN